MNIEIRKISSIRPYVNNPRVIDGSVEAVANSIQEFGFSVPIVVDKDGVIIAGHTRFEAAKRLGLEEVPCYVAADLTEEQVQAFRLADNKVAEMSTWDNGKLSEELMGLAGSIDMSLFGFEAPRDGLPGRENDILTNMEFSLDEFDDDKFRHHCERCGFQWN